MNEYVRLKGMLTIGLIAVLMIIFGVAVYKQGNTRLMWGVIGFFFIVIVFVLVVKAAYYQPKIEY
ncbi:MAG TPA: hypothetical protein VK158_06935 [Acidobacteriota bacterium]|nr:hypothetical protein [Acidobacteriota bacterium]